MYGVMQDLFHQQGLDRLRNWQFAKDHSQAAALSGRVSNYHSMYRLPRYIEAPKYYTQNGCGGPYTILFGYLDPQYMDPTVMI